MKKWIGTSLFILVLLLVGIGNVRQIYAQATAGFTKVNTTPVSGTSFTSPTVINGAVYNVEVTAVNVAGESVPSVIVSGQAPASGTHAFILSWTAPTNCTLANPCTYNVYDQVVTVPNPPGAPSLIFN